MQDRMHAGSPTGADETRFAFLPRYAIAFAMVAAAVVLRVALGHLLAHQIIFLTFFPAVILTVWLAGTRPGIVAAVLGLVSAELFQLNSLASLLGVANLLGLSLYLFVCTSVICMHHSLRRAHDIAQRAAGVAQSTEMRFRPLMDSRSFGVVISEFSGQIIQANDSYLRIIGRTRAELDAGTLNWKQLAAPESNAVEAEITHNLRSSGEAPVLEMEFIRPDGARIPVLIGVSMLDRASQRTIAYVLDRSEQKAVERERDRLLESERQAREHMERIARIKDEFLATLSHELRTPMNAVLGWLQLLRTGLLKAGDETQAMEAIERNAKAQVQLIDDLLDISRIVSGNLRLEVRCTALASVIESAIQTLRPAAEAKHIRIYQALDLDGTTVNGDEARLRQVIWNLLSNAIKFTPPRGRVTVVLQRVNDQAEIIVADTGRGICHELLPRVFDRFWQADSSSTRAYSGVGLGLAIARQLVELHGGQIRADSSGEGQGATFTVSLPIADVSQQPSENAAPDPRNQTLAPATDPVALATPMAGA